MPRVQRSPPVPRGESGLQSESDITSANEEHESTPKITVRHKRPRVDCSPNDQFLDFKKEIKELLNSWKLDHDKALAKLTNNLAEVKEECSEIKKSIHFINDTFEDMKKSIQSLEKERKVNREYIYNLENRVQELLSSTRSATIDIKNIPQKEKETTQDLTTVVSNIGKLLETTVQPCDIRDVYRAPAKQGVTKNIVVEFVKVQTKYDIIASTRKFNSTRPKEEKLNTSQIGLTGGKVPVYIDEHLPPSGKKLYYLAREFAKKNEYKFCWISNSRIYLRKIFGAKQILVTSEKCLETLISNNQ